MKDFFGSIDHEWLIKFVEHRIADKRVIRLIQKWLNAGVLEDAVITQSVSGTPQGGIISPLLANIYLHYVFDLWIRQWRTRHATSDVIVVRFADDFVVGCHFKRDADCFLADLRARLEKFKLRLHTEKTRLIQFGRYASAARAARNLGKPETFTFLGFTHICGVTRGGIFTILRQTNKKRMYSKLKEIKKELRRRMHFRIKDTGPWLRSVVSGHFNYFAVPTNTKQLASFREHVIKLWHHALKRRSQRNKITWERMTEIAEGWLPPVRVKHQYPLTRFRVLT